MTDRKRPWWMLHWPSWVALAVFGGAFVVLNLLAHSDRGFTLRSGIEYTVGWPFVFCEIWFTERDDSWMWIWTVQTLESIADDPQYRTVELWHWSVAGISTNIVIGAFVVGLSVVAVERTCRRHGVTIRALFLALGIVAALVAVFRPSRFPFGSFKTALAHASMTVMCIAIVLDFIGWLFGRFSKRER